MFKLQRVYMHLLSVCRGFPSHTFSNSRKKSLSLSLSISFPHILSLVPISHPPFSLSALSNVENAASPLPSPWVFTSPKIKWASLSLPFSAPLFAKQLHPVPHTKCWLHHYRAYFVCINSNRVLPFPSPFSAHFLFRSFCDK